MVFRYNTAYASIIITLLPLLACNWQASQAQSSTDIPTPTIVPQRSLRLPNTTYPLRYHLHITSNIHLEDFNFTGNCTIDIEIRESTNEIVLHARNLSDFKITVRTLVTNELFDDLTYTYEDYGSYLIIHPIENYQAFEAGQQLRVEILYTAVMQERTIGLYWLTYFDVYKNRTVYLAATQSEPTYARLLLPCYDEPAFKSNFTIQLTHGSNYMAISNMQVRHLHRHSDAELTTTTFYSTPPMSTYLVAFVISDFEYISEEYRGVTHRLFTPPGSRDKGHKALKNAVRTVATLEDYFGISYPLAKLDQIALKKNYGAAMENWGLITYKEDCLIFQDDADLHKSLKDMLTQNHEISHQWFGNLVSLEWWSYAWLNEGFATYFGHVISDLLYPEQKIMEFFIHDIADRAYSYSYISVRPITFYVEKEEDILSVFDIISYKRAACIIKMFHHAFNQKTFVRGISKYLQKYQYSVVGELDLFDTLQEVVQEDELFKQQPWMNSVRDIMNSWTHSEWTPALTIIRNYENDTITFRQTSKEQNLSEHWWIPLNFATAVTPDFLHTHATYFMPPVSEITVSLAELGLSMSGRDWLIVNKQQTGFYHVHYDIENLRSIIKQLQSNHTVIHTFNRAAIFQDLSPLIQHNQINTVDVILELLKYLEKEEELLPWNLVADTMQFLERNLFGTSAHALFKQFVRRLVAPIFRKLYTTAEPLTNIEVMGRQKILEIACMADLKECLDYTHQMAHDYIFESVKFKADLDYYAMYDTILCLGVKYLSDDEFNAVIKLLSMADRDSLWYDDLIYSLRCTQDRTHIRQYLNILLGENSTHIIMNDNEAMMYLFYVYKSNLVARPVVWHFFERNYKLLCLSPFFAETFNQIAEYIPKEHLHQFHALRQLLAHEMEVTGVQNSKPIISADSRRIGAKMKASELFRDKFEHKIHEWLLNEQLPISYAASISPRSSSARLSGVIHGTRLLLKKALTLKF